jgi:hypothetical protein
MGTYAVMDGNSVINVVIAEDKATIEELLNKTCIEYTPGVDNAQIGGTYDSENNKFIPVKPYESWILNEETFLWESPVSYPNDDQNYEWNEETTSWQLV